MSAGEARVMATGLEHVRAGCPVCGWKDSALGPVEIKSLYRRAQRHADSKGHPVKVEHIHPHLISFRE